MSSLFSPLKVGALTLPNRVLMAPLTRCRAEGANVPTDLMAEYYAQRASAGLIIAEATTVSPRGHGYPNTPGIYTDEQVAGWKKVTSAVHAKGGRIFLQLWHVGRISHPAFQPNGELPVAPSAIKPAGQLWTGKEMADYVTPHALALEEIPGIVAEYVKGARLAKEAGFDGVEIHNANGYLLDQFLRSGSNTRSDGYGNSLAARARLTLEVVNACISVWGSDRVGIRLSPGGVFNDMSDANPLETFGYLLRELSKLEIAYAHVTRVTAQDIAHGAASGVGPKELRKDFKGVLITAGGFDRAQAEQAIAEGWADAIAYGVPFLTNPDLPRRLQENLALNTPDEATFYASGAKGYTDYPAAK